MITINPCSDCKSLDGLQYIIRTNSVKCTTCDKEHVLHVWDDMNPLPEPDPLAIVHEQLAECYELLEQIYLMMIPYSTKTAIKALLAKHREANNT